VTLLCYTFPSLSVSQMGTAGQLDKEKNFSGRAKFVNVFKMLLAVLEGKSRR